MRILENARENGEFVKEKLHKALINRVQCIEEEREKEQLEIKKLENMTPKQKEKYKMQQGRKNKANSKKKKKSSIEEERDAHEAYQLVLSEYHRKVKQRMLHKTKNIGLLKVGLSFGQAISNEDLNTTVD